MTSIKHENPFWSRCESGVAGKGGGLLVGE